MLYVNRNGIVWQSSLWQRISTEYCTCLGGDQPRAERDSLKEMGTKCVWLGFAEFAGSAGSAGFEKC